MPIFSLPDVEGGVVANTYFDGSQAGLVVFTCNHCPYVKGSEDSLIAIITPYLEKGLRVISISANDAVKYPEDSFENMKARAKAMKLPYPYLFDESQQVARSFDAECTPECFLFDAYQRLAYHGAINDSPRDPTKVTTQYLETAIRQLLSGEAPSPAFAHPIGCSIKWK
jgi:peroxiredoxin